MKKTWIILSIIISIIIISIGGFVLLNNKDNPDKIIEKYCKILVKGNYGDIIDIAYLPENELFTKERIEQKKKQYFEEMRKDNNNVTSYEYSKTNEDEEKISYKVILNGTETKNIDINKSNNKIIIDGLYEEKEIDAPKGFNVSIDNISLTKIGEKEDVDTFKALVFTGLDYKVKISHPFFNDKIVNLGETFFSGANMFENLKDENLKKEISNTLDEFTKDIYKVCIETKQIDTLNKYFANSNAKELLEKPKTQNPFGFMDIYNLESDTIPPYQNAGGEMVEQPNWHFVGTISTSKAPREGVDEVSENKITLKQVSTSCHPSKGKGSYIITFKKITFIKQDNAWKIQDWEI